MRRRRQNVDEERGNVGGDVGGDGRGNAGTDKTGDNGDRKEATGEAMILALWQVRCPEETRKERTNDRF